MDEVTKKAGTLATIIRKTATNPWLRSLAAKIIFGEVNGAPVRERDYEGEVTAFYNYVKNRVRYTRDPYLSDIFEDPEWTHRVRIGDCDALTTLLGSLLASTGHKVYLKIVDYGNGQGYSHVYLLSDQAMIPLDPALPSGIAGQEIPYYKTRIFEV